MRVLFCRILVYLLRKQWEWVYINKGPELEVSDYDKYSIQDAVIGDNEFGVCYLILVNNP